MTAAPADTITVRYPRKWFDLDSTPIAKTFGKLERESERFIWLRQTRNQINEIIEAANQPAADRIETAAEIDAAARIAEIASTAARKAEASLPEVASATIAIAVAAAAETLLPHLRALESPDFADALGEVGFAAAKITAGIKSAIESGDSVALDGFLGTVDSARTAIINATEWPGEPPRPLIDCLRLAWVEGCDIANLLDGRVR